MPGVQAGKRTWAGALQVAGMQPQLAAGTAAPAAVAAGCWSAVAIRSPAVVAAQVVVAFSR